MGVLRKRAREGLGVTSHDAFLSLLDLPQDHRLRNTPLAQIGAEYQFVNTKEPAQWHRVRVSHRIGKNTLNELGANWTVAYRWRAADPDP